MLKGKYGKYGLHHNVDAHLGMNTGAKYMSQLESVHAGLMNNLIQRKQETANARQRITTISGSGIKPQSSKQYKTTTPETGVTHNPTGILNLNPYRVSRPDLVFRQWHYTLGGKCDIPRLDETYKNTALPPQMKSSTPSQVFDQWKYTSFIGK